jgi:molybdopterin-guanine dinucleotide biosynthesis protein A
MERYEKYSLLLLAGGKSARMGTPKAELQYEGKSFLDHMLDKARALGIRNCYISGYDSRQADVTTVWDHFPERGPLGGLHACMKAISTPYCLVLPVDAPKLPVEILEALLQRHEASDPNKVLIWEHGVRQEPLIAVYPTAMADAIEDLIRDHAAPVFRAIDSWGFESFRMEMESEQILNINTPELYKKLLGENIDTAKPFAYVCGEVEREQQDEKEHWYYTEHNYAYVAIPELPTWIYEFVASELDIPLEDVTDEWIFGEGHTNDLLK